MELKHNHLIQLSSPPLSVQESFMKYIKSEEFFGKNFLVIGATSPIASAIADLLSQLNANVLQTSFSVKKSSEYIDLDISKTNSILKLSKKLLSQGLLLDGIINCAGITEIPSEIEEGSIEVFRQVMEVNVIGTWNLIRILSGNMKRPSRFVQIAGGGASGPMIYLPAYSASKSAVVRLVETLSIEMIQKDIYINCLGPGAIDSSMTRRILKSQSNSKVKSAIGDLIPGKQGYFDPMTTALCVAMMMTSTFSGVSGRFFSAQWDDWNDPAVLAQKSASCSSAFALRRVICD